MTSSSLPTSPTSPRQLTRRFALLTALRWLPLGLVIPVEVLVLQARGLDLPTIGALFALYGVVVALLELPTGGLADAWGRRPVLVASSALTLLAVALFAVATTLPGLAAAALLLAVGRALSSGPLEAWYVDTAHAFDASADVTPGIARAGVAEGIALAVGAVAGGLLPSLFTGLPAQGDAPVLRFSVPLFVAAALVLVEIAALLLLVREAPREGPRARAGQVLRDVPASVRSGVAVGTRDAVARRVLLRTFWMAVGGASLELLVPIRLAELLGAADDAAATYGLLVTAAMLGAAAGSGAATLVRRLAGSARRGAIVMTVLGAGALAALGAPSVVVLAIAFVAAELLIGVAFPLVKELLHARVSARERATMLSAQSLVAMLGFVLGSLALPALASHAGTGTAITVGGAAWLLGAAMLVGARGPTEGGKPLPGGRRSPKLKESVLDEPAYPR